MLLHKYCIHIYRILNVIVCRTQPWASPSLSRTTYNVQTIISFSLYFALIPLQGNHDIKARGLGYVVFFFVFFKGEGVLHFFSS